MAGKSKSKSKTHTINPYIKFFVKYKKEHPQLPATIAAQQAGKMWRGKKSCKQ